MSVDTRVIVLDLDVEGNYLGCAQVVEPPSVLDTNNYEEILLKPGEAIEIAYSLLTAVHELSCGADGSPWFQELSNQFAKNKKQEDTVSALVVLAHECGWNGVDNSKILHVFIQQHIEELKAEIKRLQRPPVEIVDAGV